MMKTQEVQSEILQKLMNYMSYFDSISTENKYLFYSLAISTQKCKWKRIIHSNLKLIKHIEIILIQKSLYL